MSKKTSIWRQGSIGIVAALMLATPAFAQEKSEQAGSEGFPVPRIAIINVEVALQESKAVQSARTQMEVISAKYKKEIESEEAEIRKLDQELQQQRTILAPEALAQKRADLQQKAASLQRKARSVRQAMDQGFKETMQRIQGVLFEEVAKVAKEVDVNLVIPSSQIIVAVESYDITRQAIERLDKRLPEVKLTLEQKAVDAVEQGANPRPAR